jgi:hypothetical protein
MFDTNKQLGGKRKNARKPTKGKKCGGSKRTVKNGNGRSKRGGVTLGDALVPAALYAGLRYLKRRSFSSSKKSTRKMSRKSRSK